jgi:hypothetical protein
MAKSIDQLVAKKIGPNQVGIYDGETMIGEVSPALDGLMRPTSTWTYTIPNHHKGQVFDCNGAHEAMIDYINWRAGKSWKEAAQKLAHKLGYK